MRRHGPVIAHCTDSKDFPVPLINAGILSNFCKYHHKSYIEHKRLDSLHYISVRDSTDLHRIFKRSWHDWPSNLSNLVEQC